MKTLTTEQFQELTESEEVLNYEHAGQDICQTRGQQKYYIRYADHEETVLVENEPERQWGGPREGAGRPATGRKKQNFYITDEENEQLRQCLEELRNPSK